MGKEKEEMRDQIIKYLQGIQCEWFPVEWDSFMVEWIESAKGCNHEGMKAKYRFEEHFVIVNYSYDIPYQMFYYGTLDRCKTLLRNAVRSAIESKDPAGHPRDYKVYISVSGAIKIVSFPKGGAWETVVWQNGEFK